MSLRASLKSACNSIPSDIFGDRIAMQNFLEKETGKPCLVLSDVCKGHYNVTFWATRKNGKPFRIINNLDTKSGYFYADKAKGNNND